MDHFKQEIVDQRGITFEEIEDVESFVNDGESRCRKCAFSTFDPCFDCLADEYGMPACEERLDGKKVYFKKVS